MGKKLKVVAGYCDCGDLQRIGSDFVKKHLGRLYSYYMADTAVDLPWREHIVGEWEVCGAVGAVESFGENEMKAISSIFLTSNKSVRRSVSRRNCSDCLRAF